MTSSTPIVNSSASSTCSTESPAKQHNLRVTPISRHSNFSHFNFMKIVMIVLLFFSCFPLFAAAQNWDCPTPQGSYLDSCDRPIGHPYQSTDPRLSGIKFCQYTVSCKKINQPSHIKRTSNKILPREDLACAKNWENCDGFLIGREGRERLCQNEKQIEAQLREHALLNERDEL